MGGKIGGALPPVSSLRVQTKQIMLLKNFRSRTPQLVKGLLNNIVERKASFHPNKLPAVQKALLKIMEVEDYKDLAQVAYQTLFQPIKEVPAAPKPELPVPAPAVPAASKEVQLPPTTKEFLAEDCPLEVLLFIRATGKFFDVEDSAFSGKAKSDARTMIRERISHGSITLDEIVKIISSPGNTNVICGAIKAIGDLKPASVGGKPAEAYLEGLRDLAPQSAIGETAAAVLREAYEKDEIPPTLPPRPKIPSVSPPPTEEVLKPLETPGEELVNFEEDAMTIPVPTMRPVAETTPETVLKYMQDEVSYLVQQDARLRQSLSELEKRSGELNKQGGERTKAVASLKTIVKEQSELYEEQLKIEEANYQAHINVEEIKNLETQLKTAETKDLIQAAILKETLDMAVEPIRESYEEKRAEIKARMNQALRLTERNGWINAQEREIASIKANLEGLSAQVGEIKDQLAANQDEARALLDRIGGHIRKLQVQKNSLLKILPETEIGRKS